MLSSLTCFYAFYWSPIPTSGYVFSVLYSCSWQKQQMHAWAEVCHLLQSSKSVFTGFLSRRMQHWLNNYWPDQALFKHSLHTNYYLCFDVMWLRDAKLPNWDLLVPVTSSGGSSSSPSSSWVRGHTSHLFYDQDGEVTQGMSQDVEVGCYWFLCFIIFDVTLVSIEADVAGILCFSHILLLHLLHSVR